MTTMIEHVFGARVMVRGFLLNNQLTDSWFAPDANGKPIANRVQPGKRPRSSMAPTLVLTARARAGRHAGSPVGSQIIGYVAKTLVGHRSTGASIPAGDCAAELRSAMDRPELERGRFQWQASSKR